MAKDLHTFLGSVKEKPIYFETVKREVDPLSFETAAILKHLQQQKRNPIVFFEKVKAVNRGPSIFPLVDNLFATRELCALALELPPEKAGLALSLEFSKRENDKIEPVLVEKGKAPIKEVIIKENDVDLTKFPAGRFHEMDVGPYFTMTDIMRGEGGFYDVSFVKHLILDKKFMTVSLHYTIRKHLLYILEANEEKNRPTPIVVVLGHHPAFFLGAGALKELGNNDYETIGAFLGEPLRLTPSETWGEDFLVPADAEIVIEGEVIPHKREIQNPFGEYSGYYQPQCLMPVMEVKVITHRKNAIMQQVFPASSGHFNLGSIPKEGSIYNEIKKVAPEVTGVYLPHSGSGRISCYVSVKKRREGDAKQAGLMPFLLSGQIKYVVVVDDDVDIYNEQEVLWALITRLDLSRGVDLIKNMPRYDRVLIDATRPLDRPFPAKNTVPREVMERIRLSDYLS